MSKIVVKDTEINVVKINEDDYICLTDMLKAKDGDFFITDWLRNRNTLEYIGIWEKVYNPNFNYGEFATIRKFVKKEVFFLFPDFTFVETAFSYLFLVCCELLQKLYLCNIVSSINK